jgi:acyltransferase
VTFSFLNRKVALVAGVYGNYFYFYLAAMAGIWFWMELAFILPTLRLFSRIGQNTLTIFSLHLLVFPFITAVLVYGFKMPSQLKFESASLSVAYAVISILVLLPISHLINRYFPFILGETRKPLIRTKSIPQPESRR